MDHIKCKLMRAERDQLAMEGLKVTKIVCFCMSSAKRKVEVFLWQNFSHV